MYFLYSIYNWSFVDIELLISTRYAIVGFNSSITNIELLNSNRNAIFRIY